MQYAIHAIQKQQPVRLLIDAADAQSARYQAQAQGLAVMSVKPASNAWSLKRLGAARGPAFPLLHFNQSLLILLGAGLSIVEAVDTLADRETRADAKRVLQKLHASLGVGLALSAALAEQPAIFPPLYVASVRANETTGGLVEAIERFNLYHGRAELLKKRVVSACIYPAMILLVGGAVVLFLLLYVVPRFAVVFEDMGDRVPAMSRLLLAWGQFMHSHGAAVLGGLVLAVVGLLLAARQPAVRAALLRAVQRLPRVGELLRVFHLARFYRALSLLVQAGTPLVQALDLARDLLPASLHAAVAAARRDMTEGQSVSAAFEAHGLATVIARRLLRVAERTGAMGDMLERTAAFHDEDITQSIDWFVRLFEPLLMLAIGLVIGVVVLLMYAPIFELAGSLQ